MQQGTGILACVAQAFLPVFAWPEVFLTAPDAWGGVYNQRCWPVSIGQYPPPRGNIHHATINGELQIFMAFNQGAQVEHQKFGLGTVMSINDERMVIKFDDHGEKKFVTPMVMASLKKSDRAAPI